MQIQSIHLHQEFGIVQTKFSNFTPFIDFEKILCNTFEEMKSDKIHTWMIDLSDVVILGKHHLDFFIDVCLPRIKHLMVVNVKIIRSKFNFDTTFERNLKRALLTMNFNFEYSHGIHEMY